VAEEEEKDDDRKRAAGALSIMILIKQGVVEQLGID
jgi:hypothetical protein